MHTDMRKPIRRLRTFHPRHIEARQSMAQQRLDLGEEARMAPGIQQVFQPRLLAIRAVAMGDEDAKNGIAKLHDFAW